MATTRANQNRKLRQDNLREMLSNQKHIESVCEMVEHIKDLNEPLSSDELQRYKVAIDAKFKLIDKFLPNLKQQEVTVTTDVILPQLSDADLERIANS